MWWMEEMRMRGAVGGTRGRSDMGRDRKRKREGGVCPNGLPKSVGRNGRVWVVRIKNSVDDGEDWNGEMCMGVCV